MEMIKADQLSVKLESFSLKDISFVLPTGYIIGLIGCNGAGKTSLLNTILGIHKPQKGILQLFGETYERSEKKIRQETGWVLGADLFCAKLTLEENASLYGSLYDRYDGTVFARYCELFSLDGRSRLGKLSKGEYLKFQLAFALAHDPKLLILDEPMANFDPEFRKQFLKIITRFVEDGAHSCLIASHLLKDLERVADYVMMLQNGRLLFMEEWERLTEQYRLLGGEDYLIRKLPKDKVISVEKGEYGTKALVQHTAYSAYDAGLAVRIPTLEEIMYFISRKGDGTC